jgi:DNA polymerase II small subunit/DNA polymerase delta subunit B
MLKHNNKPTPKVISKNLKGSKFKFGIVSDTHFGSKFEAINELHTFYKRAIDDGCNFIVHAGDMVDGSASMHKGFLYELHALGADEQISHVIENYPKGIDTYYITGNHDNSHFKQNGTSIAKTISKERKDLIYCGEDEADININGIIIRMFHGGNGAYALSYPAQKYINGIQGGNKPHILALGHLHTAYYLPYRNIHTIGAGCYQWQSRWMRAKALNPVVGGWIIEVEHKDNEILTFNSNFVQFYSKEVENE